MKEYLLKIAQDGFAAGEIYRLMTEKGMAGQNSLSEREKSVPNPLLERERSGRELARFEEAVQSLDRRLTAALSASDENSASIYEAERMMLKDQGFTNRVRHKILEEKMDAVTAVEKSGRTLAGELAGSESDYIRQRSEDISGITDQLLAILRDEEEQALASPSILVAKELSPAQISAFDPTMLLGIITAKGSPTSHVSILAGNMKIPYFYGSEEAVQEARTGKRAILVDGRLILDPDESALSRMKKEKDQIDRTTARDRRNIETRTAIYANIGGPQDIPALQASGAQGVGLFRTEFLFLHHDHAPTEKEQFETYKTVLKAMHGKETIIRTMDLGSDKQAGWLTLADEKNPALGCRGLRLSLKEIEMFKIQLRAILRAAVFGDLKVMVPMVTSAWEIDAVRKIMEEAMCELIAEGISCAMPPLGIMIETPAAALTAEELAPKADFFSIGTNDLTQYTLALDREAQGLDKYYDPCHEAVMRLIKMTAAAARKNHISVCVCGELASHPDVIGKLIEYGTDKLSVSIGRIDTVKMAVMEAEKKSSPPPVQVSPDPAEIAAPADGKLIPMDQIPDPVFSRGTMGECIGILPENGNIYAPCQGIVTGIARTMHAMTITAADGREILIHAGIDTVTLKGRGFKVFVKEGDHIEIGDLIMQANLDLIRQAGLSPIVITAMQKQEKTENRQISIISMSNERLCRFTNAKKR